MMSRALKVAKKEKKQYHPKTIESKWQRFWDKADLYRAKDFSKKPKLYLLVEFPYPSGAGLHVGHCRSYVALDAVARKKRMEGYNVLFPMGWDAFGLPTENYAIKTGVHPKVATRKNTAFFKKQEKSLGLSFDWSREINTTDPEYYKWTQRIFLQMFEQGLAYKAKIPINWCLSCKIGLANEEVVEGKCERCGGEIEKRKKEQWLIKITEYAERLLRDLDKVEYPERVKVGQREWIGKSEGYEVIFKLCILTPRSISPLPFGKGGEAEEGREVRVFTTRLDTIFGCTYLVVAPEHNIISNIKNQISNIKEIENYIDKTKKKSDRDRQADVKQKTGVKMEGVVAVNPANGKEIPIFVADYVLPGYGTGAIMAVPAHDQRDLLFARCYNLPIQEVIAPQNLPAQVFASQKFGQAGRESMYNGGALYEKAYEGEGVLINSDRFNGLQSDVARERLGEWLQKQGLAEKAVYYKLRDWIFSRQRYWGEPIPLVFCNNCKTQAGNSKSKILISKQILNSKFQISKKKFNKGELLNPGWVAVPEKELPVKLPNVKNYKPTESGESPLANVKSWVKTKCPKCGGPAVRETDVMPNWAGSNWYYLAYTMKKSQISNLKSQKYKSKIKKEKYAWNKKRLRYWMPVDWYNGGMEHTTLHLLYSRFVYKFLWDIGAVPKQSGPEPYKKRTSHGMILGEGGIKMSKSKGNVLNPEDVVKKYGADTLRVYELFMGPFAQAIAWDTKSIKGVYRFLEKICKLKFQIPNSKSQINPKSKIQNTKLKKLLHKTIKKVSEDIEAMKFNTAVSALMVLVNEMEKLPEIPLKIYKLFLVILSPFAPHLSEELWNKAGGKQSIFLQKWPKYDKKLIEEEKIVLLVQVNGKVRDKIETAKGISEAKAKKLALESEKIKRWLVDKQVKNIIFVPNKLINIVA